MDCKTLFIFCSLVVAIGAQSNSTKFLRNYRQYNNSALRNINYLDLNRRQFADIILDWEQRLDTFRRHYRERLDLIDMQLEILIDGMVKTNERLNPLEVLSDISKDCVAKYRSKIPKIAATKTTIQGCISKASGLLAGMTTPPENTKNNLRNFYNTNFERDLQTCEKTYPTLDVSYAQCAMKVVANVYTHTKAVQKTFDAEMDSAACSSKANLKRAIDCTFIAQNQTIALITEADVMIDRCLHGLDDCDRCSEGHFCDSVYYLPQHQVETKNSTMINPFFGRNSTSDCLMLEIY